MSLGILTRRNYWTPTLWGWVLVCVILVILGFTFLLNAHDFLSKTEIVEARVILVEGRTPDPVIALAGELLLTNQKDSILILGGPIERGKHLTELRYMSEMVSDRLNKIGVPNEKIVQIKLPETRGDNIEKAARYLAQWMKESNSSIRKLDIITQGPEARRCQFLFQKALGESYEIGGMNVPPEDYNPKRWWTYSEGIKKTLNEGLSWIYAKLFFEPKFL